MINLTCAYVYVSADCCIDITSVRVYRVGKTGIILASVETEVGPQRG